MVCDITLFDYFEPLNIIIRWQFESRKIAEKNKNMSILIYISVIKKTM